MALSIPFAKKSPPLWHREAPFIVRRQMIRLSTFLLCWLFFGLCNANEVPCTFIISGAGISARWHIVQGAAEVSMSGSHHTAMLFGQADDPNPSHIFEWTLESNRVSGTLLNKYSEGGLEIVTGLYVKEIDPHSGKPAKIFESLIAHNGITSVGITCYDHTSHLTHQSTRPAKKSTPTSDLVRK